MRTRSLPRRQPRPALALIAAAAFLAVLLPFPGANAAMDAPISVSGDTDLAAQAAAKGWPGTGTAADPYIIQGHTIDASTQTGIRLASTTKHVLIRNNAIEGAFAPYFGIELAGARNAVVEDNTIHAISIGLYIHAAQDDTVRRNTITTATYGIAVVSSGRLTVADNTVSGAVIGLQVLLTTGLRAEGNDVQASSRGYYQNGGSANLLTGNTLRGPVTQGVYLFSTNGNTVQHNTILHGTTGIHVKQGTGNLALNNTIQNGTDGIFLDAVTGNTLKENRIANNTDEGILLHTANANTLIGNDIHGHPKGIHLFFSNQNVVTGGALTNNTIGLLLFSSLSATVTGVHVSGSIDGGIVLRSSRLNTLTDNVVEENKDGIRLESCTDNVLNGSDAQGNQRGIVLQLGSRHIVRRGLIDGNGLGIVVQGSKDNKIYDNRFDNDQNALVTGSVTNTWSVAPAAGTNIVGGPYVAGNWWSDYTGFDLDLDGLGEVPHSILPYGNAAAQNLGSLTGIPYGPQDENPLIVGVVQHPLL